MYERSDSTVTMPVAGLGFAAVMTGLATAVYVSEVSGSAAAPIGAANVLVAVVIAAIAAPALYAHALYGANDSQPELRRWLPRSSVAPRPR